MAKVIGNLDEKKAVAHHISTSISDVRRTVSSLILIAPLISNQDRIAFVRKHLDEAENQLVMLYASVMDEITEEVRRASE